MYDLLSYNYLPRCTQNSLINTCVYQCCIYLSILFSLSLPIYIYICIRLWFPYSFWPAKLSYIGVVPSMTTAGDIRHTTVTNNQLMTSQFFTTFLILQDCYDSLGDIKNKKNATTLHYLLLKKELPIYIFFCRKPNQKKKKSTPWLKPSSLFYFWCLLH